jgi:hypothetical protein
MHKSELLEIENVRYLVVRPGEMLMIQLDHLLPPDRLVEMGERLKEMLPSEVKLVITSPGTELEIVDHRSHEVPVYVERLIEALSTGAVLDFRNASVPTLVQQMIRDYGLTDFRM